MMTFSTSTALRLLALPGRFTAVRFAEVFFFRTDCFRRPDGVPVPEAALRPALLVASGDAARPDFLTGPT